MNQLFPLSFPPSTIFYLVVYLASLLLHVVFMNYVLAGSLYLAATYIRSSGNRETLKQNRIAMIIQDWLPFVLSAAITAGVAPLLFIQVLYKQTFYTANLLLFHRWMAIVPVLIIGFYLLYLLKSRWLKEKKNSIQILTATCAFLCFLFTAFSWTENHVLSRQGVPVWAEFYEKGLWMYRNPEIFPRLAMWVSGSFTTLVVLLNWQMCWKERFNGEEVSSSIRSISNIGIVSIITTSVLAIYYLSRIPPETAEILRQPIAKPYFYSLFTGMGIFTLASFILRGKHSYNISWLLLQSIGLFVSMVSVAVLRECVRIRSLGIEQFYLQHEEAAKIGGFGAFVLFTILNAIAIGICVYVVKRHQYLSRSPGKTS